MFDIDEGTLQEECGTELSPAASSEKVASARAEMPRDADRPRRPSTSSLDRLDRLCRPQCSAAYRVSFSCCMFECFAGECH